MRTKLGILAIALALVISPAIARVGGGAAPPPGCTAAMPSQAVSAGYSSLVLCDTFSSMSQVDVNGAGGSQRHWFTTPVITTRPQTPSAYVTTDGTGLQLLGSPDSNSIGRVMQTLGRKAAAPYYYGTPVTGSFYAEMDMKFDPNTPAPAQGGSQIYGNSPAFWVTSNYRDASGNISGAYPWTEIDIFEYLPGSTGQPGLPNFQLHHWTYNGGSSTTDCDPTSPRPTGYTYSSYNRYGVLFKRAADNGGTGLVQWYVNDALVNQCTYTQSGVPSCTYGGTSGCPAGAFYDLETQSFPFIIGTGYYPWPTTARNFHVWQ